MGSGTSSQAPRMLVRQLFDKESSTYTYLLGDLITKECALIDPVIEQVDRDDQLIRELGLNLVYCLNTHVHADHKTGSGLLKKKWTGCRSVLGAGASKAMADIKLEHLQVLKLGGIDIEARSTPGHTNGCTTYVVRGESDAHPAMAFTGDTLLIRGCGRTDFQEGSNEALYKSVHEQIFTLPDDTIIYPAHDYKGKMSSTVWEEKTFNPRLTKTLEEFSVIMNNLNLPYPKQIDASLPMNMVCGLHELLPKEQQALNDATLKSSI